MEEEPLGLGNRIQTNRGASMMEEETKFLKFLVYVIVALTFSVGSIIMLHEYWADKERQDFLKAGYSLQMNYNGFWKWVGPEKAKEPAPEQPKDVKK